MARTNDTWEIKHMPFDHPTRRWISGFAASRGVTIPEALETLHMVYEKNIFPDSVKLNFAGPPPMERRMGAEVDSMETEAIRPARSIIDDPQNPYFNAQRLPNYRPEDKMINPTDQPK